MLVDAQDTRRERRGVRARELWTTTLKAISVGAVFSVVGAATADSVF